MRRPFVTVLALVAAAAAQSGGTSAAGPTQAPAPPPAAKAQDGQDVPTFRAGTDLLTLDVSVLDGKGRPVEGLKPEDFSVKINGQTRKVTQAELVRADSDQPGVQPGSAVGQPTATTVTTAKTAKTATPVTRPGGRRFLIAVDQQHIQPGSIKPLLNAASDFVDRMTARDLAAFVAFPEPGPHTDFTNDKALLRKAMQGLVGQSDRGRFGEYDIGLAEALTIVDRERRQVNVNTESMTNDPPVFTEVMERSCTATATDTEGIKRCKRDILSQAEQMAQVARLDAKISIRTLESIIQGLIPVEGSKSLVLISASLTIDSLHDLDTLIHLAEAARLSIDVILVDVPREGNRTSANQPRPERPIQTPTGVADRRLLSEGLEELAGDGRGDFYRLAGTGAGPLGQIALKLSASYVLGVESKPEDLRGELGTIDVTVPRLRFKGRVSQAFARAPAAAPVVPRSLEERLRSALAAPSTFTDLPLQVATFLQWDPASTRVRVRLAAQVGQPGIQPGDYVVGYVVTDREGRTVVDWSQRQELFTPGTRSSAQPFGDPLHLEPGVYTIRLGIVDSAGRQGTEIRELNVQRSTAGDLQTSDLLVGSPGQPLAVSVEPRVTGGIAAYLELYSAMPEDLDWTLVTFEIAKDATSPALADEAAEIVEGKLPSWRVATAVVEAGTLEPGRYVARARVVHDGKTVGVVTRPFVLERARGSEATPAAK